VRQDDDGFKRRLLGISPDKLPEEVNQQRLARQFIAECFHDAQTKTNLRAYHSYPEPVTFAGRLRQHLRELIDARLGDTALTSPRWEGEPYTPDARDSQPEALTSPRWEGEPYRAFDVFDLQHADIFHGRDASVADLEALLRRRADLPFVVVIGASGSGKSSLVRAGLAASLVGFNLDETISGWLTALLIPGECDGQLLHGLARELCEVLPGLRERHLTPEILAGRFAQKEPDIADLTLAFQQPGLEKVKVLLLIDQLEELHTDRRLSPEQRDAFYRALHALARSGRFWIVATLRSDFYALAQRDPAFLALKGGDGQFDLLPPEPSALRRMITEPARLAGLVFEKDERSGKTLDQLLLDDATSQPDALPLLEFTLHELYLRRQGRQLTLASYRRDLGSPAGAVGKRADSVFQALPATAQAALPGLLQKLITLDPSTEFTAVRRRSAYDPADADSPEGQLIVALTRARLLSASQTGGQSTLSLSHEALLTSWDKVTGWIKQNHSHLRLRASVEQSQARWEAAQQNPSLLLPPGLPLEEGRKLLQEAAHLLDEKTAHYLRTSITHDEVETRRRARLRRNVAVGLSTLALVAVIGAIFGWLATREAKVQRNEAQAQAANAKAEATRAEKALADSQVQLERSQLEEGRAWLERARTAKEKHGHLSALMLAGRAVGFQGYGRREKEAPEIETAYPLLLGKPFTADPAVEKQRQEEVAAVAELVESITPTTLPIWSSPIQAHHKERVTSVAFSPDGSKLASGSGDNTVKLWDSATGKELASSGHTSYVTSVAFSPDGSKLASGSDDKTVKLWDVATGKELASFSGHTSYVTSVAFSPDGSKLASGSDDNTVKLWDIAAGKELATFSGHTSDVTSVAFSPDGSKLASGSGDKTVKLWDSATGKELPGEPDFPWSQNQNRAGSLEAVMDGVLIRLRSRNSVFDLLVPERDGHLKLEGREVVWSTNPSLLSAREFKPIHYRPDLVAQLAAEGLAPAERLKLRLQLCAKENQWRALLRIWQEAQLSGQADDPALRREFLVLLAASMLPFASLDMPQVPSELVAALADTLPKVTAADFSDLRLSLVLSQVIPFLLRQDKLSPATGSAWTAPLLKSAPLTWLEAVCERIAKDPADEKTPESAKQAQASFIEAAVKTSPGSESLLRSRVRVRQASAADWGPLTERLLALPSATADDYLTAANAAAKEPTLRSLAKELLDRAEAQFATDRALHITAGWLHLEVLHDPAAALSSFESARKTLEPDQKTATVLLAGLSLTQWLNNQSDAAIATCQQLIEAVRTLDEPKDWADPKTITALDLPETIAKPLEALRTATLAKHPELATPKE